MSKDINIIKLTKKMLERAIEQNLYWGDDNSLVPFSKTKAKWVLKNPRMDNNDYCAIMGFENNTLVSFIFLVPDLINSNDGLSKVYWSDRWWIHKKYKDTILSAYTQNISYECTKNQILIKKVGKHTVDYYKKQPFTEFSKRMRYIFIFKVDTNLITDKLRFLKALSFILNIISKISFFLISKINLLKISEKKIRLRYITKINDKEWFFIKKHTINDLIPKSKSYINWQIDNNQYTNSEFSKRKCLVSSISYEIRNINFFIIKNDDVIGFISILVRGNEFIVRYFLCEKVSYSYCLNELMRVFFKSKCIYLLTDDEILGEQISKKFIYFYKNKKHVKSLAHFDINSEFVDKHVYQQDGNFA